MKVIEFKANGQEFKYSNKDLVKFSDNVYLDSVKDEYGYKDIFFHYNGVFAYVDRLPEGYENEEQKIRLEGFASNLLEFYLNKSWVNVVDLEFARVAGFGYDTLLKRRQELTEIREQKEIEKQQERLKKEQEAEKLRIEKIEDSKNRLLNKEYITYNELVDLMDYKGFKIPIRTKGAIMKLGNLEIKEDSGYFPNKTSRTTKDSIFNVVTKFIEYVRTVN